MKSLADRARAYIGKMDAAIQGQEGDKQTFVVACKLVEFGLRQSEAAALLAEYNMRCKPEWSEKELEHKLKCAYSTAAPNPKFLEGQYRPLPTFTPKEVKSKWPKVNAALQKRIISEGIGLADLQDFSPLSFDPAGSSATVAILSQLFPNDPLICVGMSNDVFWTARISEYGNRVEKCQLVVPSPMSKLKGKIQNPTKDGPTESAHTKDNTGPRRFAVVEFDAGSSDEHAALLWHLSEYAPLVMAVHSGGKSLHGWFNVFGEPEDRVLRFYRYAVAIGGDYHTYTKVQFVRMPDGLRDNGKRQSVYYFNPSLLPA